MRKRNRLVGAPLIISMARIERRVTSSHKWREVSFDISVATVDILKGLRNAVFAAFSAAQLSRK
jgi:hypothetical protein